MGLLQKAAENADEIATVATRVAYTSGGAVFLIGGLTVNELAALVGIGVAVATFFVNLVFRTLEHRARMKRLNAGRRSDTDLDQLP